MFYSAFAMSVLGALIFFSVQAIRWYFTPLTNKDRETNQIVAKAMVLIGAAGMIDSATNEALPADEEL